MTPLGKRVLLAEVKNETSKGGILMPVQHTNAFFRGRVIALGGECDRLTTKDVDKTVVLVYSHMMPPAVEDGLYVVMEDDIVGKA